MDSSQPGSDTLGRTVKSEKTVARRPPGPFRIKERKKDVRLRRSGSRRERGGEGKLPMAAFRSLCEAQGFTAVRTHLVSGNAVFLAPISAADVRAALEPGLSDLLKKTARVFVRTAEDMTRICLANPFPEAEPNRVACVFLDAAPPADLFDGSKGLSGEQVRSGEREIYIHYPLGMGVSKLVLPAAKSGTARNLLTVRRLADSAEGLLARG